MTSATQMHKGWCPGARRPMRARDGLLVRLKISCSILSATAMRGIAKVGRIYGNGHFDLTGRANLQIRGVRENQLLSLVEALEVFDLIDANAAAEVIRNILVSPLSGLAGRGHALAAAKALEVALAENIDLYALSAKFGFLIDDGSTLSLSGIPADVRFDWKGGREGFLIAIGGTTKDAIALGRCEAKYIPQIAISIARAFLNLALQMPEPPRRMCGLIETRGADAIAAASGLRVDREQRHSTIEASSPIGLLNHHEKYCFGAGAPFGSLDADMLLAAANGAEMFGTGEIRLTPWRTVIVPHVREKQVQDMRNYFAAHGFIVDREDARMAVAACGGSSHCERSTTDTRSDALALMHSARRLRKTGVSLQVFGCGKCCGRRPGTPLTLTAQAGLYDLAVDETSLRQSITNANRLTLAAAREKLETLAHDAGRQSKPSSP
jgi:precorrin-3B synthase